MTSKETVFFTGGAGFIGLHVVPMLLEKDYKVRIFDNMFRGDREAVAALGDDVELIDQDVRYGGAVHAAMKGCAKVIHAAAVSINKSQSDPYESMDINMIGDHNVFAAAADHGVERLGLLLLRLGLRRPRAAPDARGRPARPQTPYCISKRAGEDLLGFYQRPGRPVVDRAAVLQRLRPGQKTTAYYTSVINHFVNRIRTVSRRSSTARASSRWTSSTSTTSPASVVLALDGRAGQHARSTSAPGSTRPSPSWPNPDRGRGADVEPIFNPRDVWPAAGRPTSPAPRRSSDSSRRSRCVRTDDRPDPARR